MGMTPEKFSSHDLAARLAREEQMNADLRIKLASIETSRTGPQIPTPVAQASKQSSETVSLTSPPQSVRTSRSTSRRLFSVWQTALLVVVALLIGFSASVFFVSRTLQGPPYHGNGYTITPLSGWHSETDGSGGVMFLDPRFPTSKSRDASQLGVIVNGLNALMFEFGSSFRLRCQDIGGVAATTTINGNVWQQRQYRCLSAQDGGIASLIRILYTTYGPTGKYYSIYYLSAIDRLDDFSNGSFETIAQSFVFS